MIELQKRIVIDCYKLRRSNLLGAHTVAFLSEVSPFSTTRYDTSDEAEHADGSDKIAKAELWGV